MIKEIMVEDVIHTAMTEQRTNMTAQLLTACKRLMKTIDECLFCLSKLFWILWVDGWEVA